MVIFACAHYDTRSEELVLAEHEMDDYIKETIFPQIKDRGRILFYVDGSLRYDPRTQFLTGGYFDNLTHIGEPLFKEQFYSARKRDNYLFFKENLDSIVPRRTFIEFVKNKMVNADTLLDRTLFLCKKKRLVILSQALQDCLCQF